jgi:DNA-binding NarL/FixJ family response regulator
MQSARIRMRGTSSPNTNYYAVGNNDNKPLSGCRVLLIEDEGMILLGLAESLISAGATIVGHAASAMSAVYMARARDFDCAVMDVKLQDGDVFPAARTVSSRGKRIVFATADPDRPELKMEWPDAEVLVKPATDEDVIRATAHACHPQVVRNEHFQ